jgi:hypothetical protein
MKKALEHLVDLHAWNVSAVSGLLNKRKLMKKIKVRLTKAV